MKLLIKDNTMNLDCPNVVLTGHKFNCSINIQNKLNYSLMINYGNNNTITNVNVDKLPYIFQVNYSVPGHYLLKVMVINHTMNVQTTIYGNFLFI